MSDFVVPPVNEKSPEEWHLCNAYELNEVVGKITEELHALDRAERAIQSARYYTQQVLQRIVAFAAPVPEGYTHVPGCV